MKSTKRPHKLDELALFGIAEMLRRNEDGVPMVINRTMVWDLNPRKMTDMEILVKMADEVRGFRDYVGEIAQAIILTKMCAEAHKEGRPMPTKEDALARINALVEQVNNMVSPEQSDAMLASVLAKKPKKESVPK